jgi:hypothetical protein
VGGSVSDPITDQRLEILRHVREGGSITQALHKLTELDGQETITLRLVETDDDTDTGVMDAEFPLERLPAGPMMICHKGKGYSYADRCELHIFEDGRRVWILHAERRIGDVV